MEKQIEAFTHQEEWPFLKTLYAQFLRHNYCPPEVSDVEYPERAAKLDALKCARGSLENLSRTRCLVCHGFGHSKKACPTAPRIETLMSASGFTKNRLEAAKGRMGIENSQHVQPGASIPKNSLAYKRTYN